MCLPYINDLSQSLSNVTLSVTPNYILAVDRELRILEINLPALKLFGVSRQQALKGDLDVYKRQSECRIKKVKCLVRLVNSSANFSVSVRALSLIHI